MRCTASHRPRRCDAAAARCPAPSSGFPPRLPHHSSSCRAHTSAVACCLSALPCRASPHSAGLCCSGCSTLRPRARRPLPRSLASCALCSPLPTRRHSPSTSAAQDSPAQCSQAQRHRPCRCRLSSAHASTACVAAGSSRTIDGDGRRLRAHSRDRCISLLRFFLLCPPAWTLQEEALRRPGKGWCSRPLRLAAGRQAAAPARARDACAGSRAQAHDACSMHMAPHGSRARKPRFPCAGRCAAAPGSQASRGNVYPPRSWTLHPALHCGCSSSAARREPVAAVCSSSNVRAWPGHGEAQKGKEMRRGTLPAWKAATAPAAGAVDLLLSLLRQTLTLTSRSAALRSTGKTLISGLRCAGGRCR